MKQGVRVKWILRAPLLNGRQPFPDNTLILQQCRWDLSLSKRFRFKERVEMEIRLDAFNALNHTQFDTVNTTLTVRSLTDPTPTNLPFDANGNLVNRNGFGTISSVRPPRNMQLSARFQF